MIRRAVILALALASASAAAQLLDFSADEVRAVLRHGPWPPAFVPDPSNRASGRMEAIALGERLFFDPRLSGDGRQSCASCHQPQRAWQDGRARAKGLAEVDRNTPSLLNVRAHRWFGWDGAGDSLWAQSIRPVLDPREMGGSPQATAALLRGDADLACRLRKALDVQPDAADEDLLVAAGKALAAFQETLLSGRSPFDDFRDALEANDRAAAARYAVAAQRGLRLFVGKGACNVCHLGPAFTNGEFHDAGIPFFVRDGGVDPGRHRGIQRLRESRFNLLGRHSDDRTGAAATKTKHVALEHRHFGEFRVPGLRNVARTAPYMHNGSLASLEEVVRHYAELNLDRLHADGESLLRPLRLTPGESADLVAFLESLSAHRPESGPRRATADCVP